MSTDRNLLFGILALQLDFVRLDQLQDGMNAWVLAKQRSLGELLVERRVLDPECRQLLEELVDRHLKQHDSDPQRSLAALGLSAMAKETLDHVHDEDVQASLVHAYADKSEGSGRLPSTMENG